MYEVLLLISCTFRLFSHNFAANVLIKKFQQKQLLVHLSTEFIEVCNTRFSSK